MLHVNTDYGETDMYQMIPRAPARLPVLRTILLVLVSMLTLASTASAQDDATLLVTPVVGVGFFPSDLIPARQSASGQLVTTSLRSGFTVGGGIGHAFGDRLEVEGRFLYSPTEATASGGGVSVGIDTNLYVVGGEIRYAVPMSRMAAPYLVGGAGVKGYESNLFSTETDAMWNVGAGVRLRLPGLPALRLEVADYMSSLEQPDGTGRMQHDLLFIAGPELGLF